MLYGRPKRKRRITNNNKKKKQKINPISLMKSPVDSGERDRELSINVNIRAGGHEAS